jgi:hypothetical protein
MSGVGGEADIAQNDAIAPFLAADRVGFILNNGAFCRLSLLRGDPMQLVALLLLLWALFGCAVVVMMVYGLFDHVAINAPVMAAVLATGTAFLASVGVFLTRPRNKRSP